MIGKPYTHAEHARCCREAAQVRHVLALQRVQVIKRGVLYCAQLFEPWTTPDGLECWTVLSDFPESARFTVACRKVRLCGGEGCECEIADGNRATTQAQRASRGCYGDGREVAA